MDRTPHPEQPAEGTDQPAYTEEESTDEEVTDDPVGENVLSKLPGGDSRDVGDAADPEQGVGPEAHGPLP
ncbi:hypothetical protein FVA74_11350 [Salinibacterium sp. dk2585]|uniref:hypothetical protein n=1 Tax=unclassified Salinibacterium TaxID=2632331 RepID=UPI0011C253B2|nr:MULTISPECIES: hypothetical protein [unclassified Salinibacterium]QEE62097.1 hypothetical protein FVA74_11350 [Salinibacterium sp. dk2585]TXK53449.1 hypothetical protein FVP63_09620 [Salinibacterium sp. dk5596]